MLGTLDYITLPEIVDLDAGDPRNLLLSLAGNTPSFPSFITPFFVSLGLFKIQI